MSSASPRLLALVPLDAADDAPFASVAAACAIGASRGIPVDAIVAGHNPGDDAARAALHAGAAQVWLVSHPQPDESAGSEQTIAVRVADEYENQAVAKVVVK